MATTIQIKRSANITAPTTGDLVEGELAYSQDKSNNGAGAKLYIESLDSGNNAVVHVIGGKYYTDIIDAASSTNSANTLVERNAQGSFSANVVTANQFIGNITGTIQGEAASAAIATTANALTTARLINLSGDLEGNVSFNGSSDVTIVANVKPNSVALGTDTTGDFVSNVLAGTGITVTGQGGESATPTVTLTNTAVTPATYGGSTAIPVFTVDQQGRLTSAANASISTSFTVKGGDGNSDTFNTGDTLDIDGADGVSTTLATTPGNTIITVSLNTTGVTANTYGGTTAIPVFTVDAYGRISSASNTSISTSFTLAADSGTNQTVSGGDTLTIAGGTGIASVVGPTDTVTLNLETSGVSASTYGGAAQQAVFTVDTYGRITSASNVTTQIALGTNTSGAYVANLVAGTGITITGLGDEGATPTITNAGVTSVTGTANEIEVSGSTGSVTIGLPNNVTVAGDLAIGGNLNVTGNVVSYGVENLIVEDSLIQLANNNISADIVDIGFYGSYSDGVGEHEHAGLFRDASDSGKFKLFQGLQGQGNLTTTVNVSGTGFSIATLVANLTGGTVSGLTANIAVGDGGTGRGTLTTNAVLFGQGTSAVGLATGTSGQVLQINGAGVPTFAMLDGGTY